MANEHSGHRQRLRQQLKDHGLETFNDINALELLLFYVIPRQNTNLIAHRLLDAFGSLAGVFGATEYQLRQIEGLGEVGSQFFPLLRALQERAELQQWLKENQSKALDTPEAFFYYFRPFFSEKRREAAYLLCLTPRGKPLGCEKLNQGGSSSVHFSNRDVIETVVRMQGQICILAHNHPLSIPSPSPEDITTTLQLRKSLADFGVLLLDHLILGQKDQWCSLAELGHLPKYWE